MSFFFLGIQVIYLLSIAGIPFDHWSNWLINIWVNLRMVCNSVSEKELNTVKYLDSKQNY
jgi:hypothetical protein